jgi:hypothetical protein
VVRNKTKKETVREKQIEIVSLFGSIDFDPKYDYKAEPKEAGSARTGRYQRLLANPEDHEQASRVSQYLSCSSYSLYS